MTKPTIRIHNQATGEIVDREMNDAEFAQYEAEYADRLAKKSEQATKDEAKAALLNRLGITADEAALLLS
jgi:hypothetical protein